MNVRLRALFYYWLLSCMCVACENNKKNDMRHLVSEWNAREIVFSKELKFSIFGQDVPNDTFPKSDYTIVAYVDSIGCTSCKLQLHRWKELINELDSVPILFFLHPKNKREAMLVLKQNNFNYPVCIDKNDVFNKLNKFPKEMEFQTFLLDKDNKVVGIGNPVHNPKVKELYLKIILGDKAPKQKKEIRTTLKMNHSSVDMGSFDWQKEQRTAFTFTNTGTYPLVIVDVTTSCGCTSAEYPKEPIAQGKDAKIEITYKADHPEHFDKTITVYCNAENSPIVLKIRGNAR